MARDAFSHVTDWVFDLDNTLYAPDLGIIGQIEARMVGYIRDRIGVAAEDAKRLCDLYWRDHGTTLAGLMAHHGVDPDPFLEAVHDIDLSAIRPDPALGDAVAALGGKRIVYTNGSRSHAERVVEQRGLTGAFDALYGIEDAGYRPKPEADAFETVFSIAEVEGHVAAMFEDDPRNLAVPHRLGMKTVLVGTESDGVHIHHRTPDLTGFLSRLR